MKIFHKILNLLFPPQCYNCEAEGKLVCKNCLKLLKNHLKNSLSNQYFEDIFILADWKNDLVRKIVRELKFKYAKDLVNDIEPFIKNSLKQIPLEKDSILVPVPLHKIRQNQRGFNQSEILARNFSMHLKIKTETNLIKRIRNTYPQSKLQGEKRRNNLKKAFQINLKAIYKHDHNKKIYIIDDVASTLTTLNECAKAFNQAGYKNLSAIILASGGKSYKK